MPDEERVYYAEWMAVERLCMYDEDEKTREKQTSVHTMRFRRAFKVPVCLWLTDLHPPLLYFFTCASAA